MRGTNAQYYARLCGTKRGTKRGYVVLSAVLTGGVWYQREVIASDLFFHLNRILCAQVPAYALPTPCPRVCWYAACGTERGYAGTSATTTRRADRRS
eukprot:3940654-Rhodomonas_salina.1